MAHHGTLLHLDLVVVVGLCTDSELIKYFLLLNLVCLSLPRVALGPLHPVLRINISLVFWTPRWTH